MKLKNGIMINKTGDVHVVEIMEGFNIEYSGGIELNDSSAYVAKLLIKKTDESIMIDLFMSTYDASYNQSYNVVHNVVMAFEEAGLLEK